ncbi:hypothetical protein GCM10018790_61750 [Kitasatospora xanthocidica]|nr:hypothetical protein GCM10018790_61750 [Kitasatospora xanthocidica]
MPAGAWTDTGAQEKVAGTGLLCAAAAIGRFAAASAAPVASTIRIFFMGVPSEKGGCVPGRAETCARHMGRGLGRNVSPAKPVTKGVGGHRCQRRDRGRLARAVGAVQAAHAVR